jgi:squalene-hopene/tetraprenyl-beta-curcumene cyclase
MVGLLQVPCLCAGWNPKLTAEYLDTRQKEWAEWPAASAPGGTCFSCHTGMTYLLARPELRRVLGESGPVRYETAVLDGLRARVNLKEGYAHFTKEPLSSQALGVETIFAALFLQTGQAFDRLWALQIGEGKDRGSWPWFQLDLDPWETTASPYYGATLAAIAIGAAPPEYRNRPDVREHVAALTAYLQREQSSQPLHNRLMLLWAALAPSGREQLIGEVFEKQQPDGGWPLAALGPWKERPQASAAAGSNAYATGFATFVLLKGGVDRADPRLTRALHWLQTHQNEQGYWEASSMNKHYNPGSMQDQFMRDAATGFAALALIEAAEPGLTRSSR